MTRLSASSVPRALSCPASLVLPAHTFAEAATEAGTERHAEMETSIDLGDLSALPERVQVMIGEGDEVFTEISFAYDIATGLARQLGHGRASYRNLAPYEIPGTLDVLVRGAVTIVIDKKGFLRVGPAETNTQTMTYALMVARFFGLDEVTVVIFYELGGVDVATVSTLDLDAHAERLKELAVTVARAATNPTAYIATGPHCRWCDAFLSCPKQHETTLDVSDGDRVMALERRIPFESDDDAARAFDLLSRAKMLTARLSAALAARATERPIPLPDGRMYGPVVKNGNERLDGDVMFSVVRDLHGQGIADAAVERKASKTRLKEALRFAGGKVAALERQVLDEVRKRGGASRDTKTVIEVHDRPALAVVK